MSVPTNVTQAAKALVEARTKGAHSVRIGPDLLDALLKSYAVLSDAFDELEAKNA